MGNRKGSDQLTTAAVAETLAVTPATVRLWANKGLLSSTTTPGGHRRFDAAEVEEFAGRFGMRAAALDRGPLRILVVDDERRVADYLARHLRAHPCSPSVRVAYDGLEAGFELNQFKPNVVIVDLMMPEVDGVQVCRFAKRERDDVRIIGITGFRNTPEELAIVEAGAEACLHKPVDLQQLFGMLDLPSESAAVHKR